MITINMSTDLSTDELLFVIRVDRRVLAERFPDIRSWEQLSDAIDGPLSVTQRLAAIAHVVQKLMDEERAAA